EHLNYPLIAEGSHARVRQNGNRRPLSGDGTARRRPGDPPPARSAVRGRWPEGSEGVEGRGGQVSARQPPYPLRGSSPWRGASSAGLAHHPVLGFVELAPAGPQAGWALGVALVQELGGVDTIGAEAADVLAQL